MYRGIVYMIIFIFIKQECVRREIFKYAKGFIILNLYFITVE